MTKKLWLGLSLGMLYNPRIQVDLNFNPYNLLAGFIFGTLGSGAYLYGRRLELWQPRLIGVLLMVYPYFFTNAWLLWGTGIGLLVALWFYHHE